MFKEKHDDKEEENILPTFSAIVVVAIISVTSSYAVQHTKIAGKINMKEEGKKNVQSTQKMCTEPGKRNKKHVYLIGSIHNIV